MPIKEEIPDRYISLSNIHPKYPMSTAAYKFKETVAFLASSILWQLTVPSEKSKMILYAFASQK